jgi:hypothetical protein
VRLVHFSEALRRSCSYGICQQQNSIPEFRALVSLKWNILYRVKINLHLPLSAHFCSSLKYLAPVNCRFLVRKLIYWTRKIARCYRNALVEIIINSESSKTMLLHRYKVTNKCVKVVVWFVNALQILPQHVSAIHCHHQGVVFTSGATQTIGVLWMSLMWITICPVWPAVEGCGRIPRQLATLNKL